MYLVLNIVIYDLFLTGTFYFLTIISPGPLPQPLATSFLVSASTVGSLPIPLASGRGAVCFLCPATIGTNGSVSSP